MTTQEARRRSPEVLGRLSEKSGFDTWQTAYLNTPVRFVYSDPVIGFAVNRPHTFSVSPSQNGDRTVDAVSVQVLAVRGQTPAAMAVARRWCKRFRRARLKDLDYEGLIISPDDPGQLANFESDRTIRVASVCWFEHRGLVVAVSLDRGPPYVVRPGIDDISDDLCKVSISIADRSTYRSSYEDSALVR
ncbi:MAG: hypothetical protein JNM50_00450 [Chromatiales bacterium]|jgi:hypothetical protein|nr:hypothetical protein [Chromatiales bacterium]